MKDTYSRISRMGNGLNRVFWKKGFPLFGHFFVSGRWSNIDLFVQLLIIPVALLCCVWFPLYYIFYAISHLVNIFGPEWLGSIYALDGTLLTAQASINLLLHTLLPMILVVLGSFLIIYPLQTFVAVYRSKKKLSLISLKGYYKGILLSPLFMLFYAVAITLGIVTDAGWKKVTRNSKEDKALK